MADQFGVRVDGVRELVRAIGALDAEARKGIGQANKAIGQKVIAGASPQPVMVGAGAGATPRASATTTSVRIMAGGSWRTERFQQWGRTYRERATQRPYIRASFEKRLPDLEREYLGVLVAAARRVGISATV